MATLDKFQQVAHQRWPRAAITGTGEWALVAFCCENAYVRLFDFYMEAELESRAHCGHAFCKMKHRVYRITPQQPRIKPPITLSDGGNNRNDL
jgi:hypothetical protein